MPLLLTIVSVLAGWALLGLLVIGLLLITKPLEGVRTSLQMITMGVRAIEKQMSPLGKQADGLAQTVPTLRSGLDGAAGHLAGVAEGLRAAGRK